MKIQSCGSTVGFSFNQRGSADHPLCRPTMLRHASSVGWVSDDAFNPGVRSLFPSSHISHDFLQMYRCGIVIWRCMKWLVGEMRNSKPIYCLMHKVYVTSKLSQNQNPEALVWPWPSKSWHTPRLFDDFKGTMAPSPKSEGGGTAKRLALREPIICEWCGELEPPSHPKQCKLRASESMRKTTRATTGNNQHLSYWENAEQM